MIRKSIRLSASATLLVVMAMATLAQPASAYDKKDAQDCNQAVDPDRTISSCTRLLESKNLGKQDRAITYAWRGTACFKKHDYECAIADFDEAIRIDPRSAKAYDRRGSYYSARADYDRAIADYSQAIRIDPKDTYHLVTRSLAYRAKGDVDLAIADCDEALRIDRKYTLAYLRRGNLRYDRGDYDLAIADYTEGIRLNPKKTELHSGLYLGRGNSWAKKSEYDRAMSDLDEAIRIAPADPKQYALRGTIWRLKGDLDRALIDQNRAIALDPTGVLIYVERGDTFRYMGTFDQAIADYTKALAKEADFIPALTGLGLTFEKMADLANARIKFVEASASQSPMRSRSYSRSALETARARLAALDSGVSQPSIPNSLPKATSATSIPTPAISAPTVAPPVVHTTVAKQGRRVALVIGNSAYKNVPVLANPQKDAEAIAASLRNIGFDQVTLANDATREKIIDSLRAFANEAEKADWAMVYYAGHGMEVGGVNYLVPTDARLAVDRDIQFEAVPLDQVLAAVDTAKKLKLVVLDACRDNPFSPRKTESAASAAAPAPTGGARVASRSIGRGLAEVKTAGGTLVVFAAKNGQVALDGDGGNSPFAVAVLQRLATPGVEINKLFRLVRDDVMEATAGRQEPYTYGSLPGKEDFYFVEK